MDELSGLDGKHPRLLREIKEEIAEIPALFFQISEDSGRGV